MVKKRSILGLNTGCTVRKGKVSWLNRKTKEFNIKTGGIRKVLIVPEKKPLTDEQVRQSVENSDLFGVDDGGIRSTTLYKRSGDQPFDSVIGSNFPFVGMYSLNKRKRWEMFNLLENSAYTKSASHQNLQYLEEPKIAMPMKECFTRVKTPKIKKLKSNKAKSNCLADIRVIAGTWKFIDPENQYKKVGASAYYDSHSPNLSVHSQNKNLKLSMKYLATQAFVQSNQEDFDLNACKDNLDNQTKPSPKKITLHHNQHCRALQRPEKWKIEKDNFSIK